LVECWIIVSLLISTTTQNLDRLWQVQDTVARVVLQVLSSVSDANL